MLELHLPHHMQATEQPAFSTGQHRKEEILRESQQPLKLLSCVWKKKKS